MRSSTNLEIVKVIAMFLKHIFLLYFYKIYFSALKYQILCEIKIINYLKTKLSYSLLILIQSVEILNYNIVITL